MAYPHESKYKKEDNWGEIKDCNPVEYKGHKASSRPQTLCKPLTCLSTVDVAGKTTLNETEVIPPAITVGGRTYVPTEVSFVSGFRSNVVGVDENGVDIIESVPVMSTILVLATHI